MTDEAFATTIRRMLLLPPLKNKQITGEEEKGRQKCKAANCRTSNKIIDSFGDHASACSAANLMTSKRQLVEGDNANGKEGGS